MTPAAVAVLILGLLCLGMFFAHYRERRAWQRHLADREAAVISERRELLNRVQRPDLLPSRPPVVTEEMREQLAEQIRHRQQWARVGTITLPTSPPAGTATGPDDDAAA